MPSWHGAQLKKTAQGELQLQLLLREIGWEGVDWIHLAQDCNQWEALVNTIMNLQVPQKAGIS
jgi:hypothetical protein